MDIEKYREYTIERLKRMQNEKYLKSIYWIVLSLAADETKESGALKLEESC